MDMPTVKPIIFDGIEQRPMNDAEYEQWLADGIEAEAKLEAEIAEAEAQAEAQAAKDAARQIVLDKLGLTQDEAQALLG